MKSGKTLASLTNAQSPFAFSRDGLLLATGAKDTGALLWHAREAILVHRLAGIPYQTHAVAFTPDGKRLATGDGSDYTVKLWDTASGRETWSFPGRANRTDAPAYALFFSPDGNRLYTGNQADVNYVWRIR